MALLSLYIGEAPHYAVLLSYPRKVARFFKGSGLCGITITKSATLALSFGPFCQIGDAILCYCRNGDRKGMTVTL